MIKPLFSNILVEPIEKNQVLVSNNQSLCEYGKVVSVGDDVKNIKVGETIGFLIWGLNKLEVEGKDYYFIPEDGRFLLAKIENEG